MHTIRIEFGVCSPTVSKQLAALKIKLPRKRLRVLDNLAESITWLYLHRIITESQRNKAVLKLLSKISAEIKKHHGKTPR